MMIELLTEADYWLYDPANETQMKLILGKEIIKRIQGCK